jgi:hypothetical protein
VRELFSLYPGVVTVESLCVPAEVTKIIIAELEDEVTELDSIIVNGKQVTGDSELHSGETLEFAVTAGDVVTFRGRYVSHHTATPQDAVLFRNKVVGSFLRSRQSFGKVIGP